MSKIDELMKDMNKTFKGDVIHRGVSTYDYERIPFTSPRLNYMTYGGIPKGKLIEFYGDEGGGKTTTALDSIANYQHTGDGRAVLYVDAENTLDVVWATKLGVSVEDMLIMNPTNQGADTIFEKVLRFIDTGEIGFVVIDSIGVLCSDRELDEDVEIGDKQYGGISMPLTRFSKQAEMFCHNYNCTLIGINQEREDFNSTYGGKKTTGGKAWKYNVAMRLRFRRGDFFDNKYAKLSSSAESPYGHKVMVDLTKTKTCSPNRKTGFYTLVYDTGIDYLYDLSDLCVKYGIIDKSGVWYSINGADGEQIAKLQGMASVYEYFNEHTDVLAMVEDLLNNKMQEA